VPGLDGEAGHGRQLFKHLILVHLGGGGGGSFIVRVGAASAGQNKLIQVKLRCFGLTRREDKLCVLRQTRASSCGISTLASPTRVDQNILCTHQGSPKHALSLKPHTTLLHFGDLIGTRGVCLDK
jgi:hypothetical protein